MYVEYGGIRRAVRTRRMPEDTIGCESLGLDSGCGAGGPRSSRLGDRLGWAISRSDTTIRPSCPIPSIVLTGRSLPDYFPVRVGVTTDEGIYTLSHIELGFLDNSAK